MDPLLVRVHLVICFRICFAGIVTDAHSGPKDRRRDGRKDGHEYGHREVLAVALKRWSRR